MTSVVRALRLCARVTVSLSKGAIVIAMLLPATLVAQQAPAPQIPPQTEPAPKTDPGQQPVPGQQAEPGKPAPPAPAPAGPATLVPGTPVAAPAPGGRTFTAPAGLLFNTVRAERVKDFEIFLGHLKFALDNATTKEIQEQAKGWRMFKAGEPGPNNTLLYVFMFDPAIKGADYGLGRILADAYPDTAQLTEIWKLYTSSVTGGGSLLNVTPLTPALPLIPPVAAPPAGPGAAR